MTRSLSINQARSAWVRHQGLHTDTGASPAEVIGATGWIRTLGGVDAYVSLAARLSGLSVAQVHAAVASGAVRVTPSVRGCIYLVPARHAPLALSLARDLSGRRDERNAIKAGTSEEELAEVGQAVLTVLSEGPQTTAGLRKLLPEGTIRSLGALGKKVGLSSTLPPALRRLEFAGRLRRQPVDDRLDHERYHWVASPEGELTLDARSAEERHVHVARLFLRWFAPASAEHLSEFSGLSKTAARKAVAALGAVAVNVEEHADACFVLPEQVDTLDEGPSTATRFLPGLDNLLIWRGGPRLFVHPDDHDRKVALWGRQKGTTWGTVTRPLSRVLMRGELVAGLWERDPDTGLIALGEYAPGLPDDLDTAKAALEGMLDELGHGNAFSIDNAERVRKRLAMVRAV